MQVDSDVAYRLKQKGVEGEWIQCTITSIIGDGPKRRWVLRDALHSVVLTFADTRFRIRSRTRREDTGSTRLMRRSLFLYPRIRLVFHRILLDVKSSHGIQRLRPSTRLKLSTRRYVLPPSHAGHPNIPQRDGTCRLRFEGEEEVGKETEVERRLVLDVSDIRR